MKKFTFLLAAALFCGSFTAFAQDDEIKVTPAFNDDFEPTFKFNKDYTYYGIYLDEETQKANLNDDQYIYIGADDDAGRHLYVWDNTYSFNTPSGNNSFDVPGGYISIKVGTIGWSGLGYANDNPIDLSGITNDYKLHIAIKSTSTESFNFKIGDGSYDGTTNNKNNPANLVFGDAAYEGNDPICNFERDGEWYNIDIPVSVLEDDFGFSFKKNTAFVGNILSILAGGKAGTTVDYDAVFFYGPKGSTNGIKGITVNTANNAVAEYYTIDGKKVSAAAAKANKGIYIVKQGNNTKKVVID